jgi:hypothetical protein
LDFAKFTLPPKLQGKSMITFIELLSVPEKPRITRKLLSNLCREWLPKDYNVSAIMAMSEISTPSLSSLTYFVPVH